MFSQFLIKFVCTNTNFVFKYVRFCIMTYTANLNLICFCFSLHVQTPILYHDVYSKENYYMYCYFTVNVSLFIWVGLVTAIGSSNIYREILFLKKLILFVISSPCDLVNKDTMQYEQFPLLIKCVYIFYC